MHEPNCLLCQMEYKSNQGKIGPRPQIHFAWRDGNSCSLAELFIGSARWHIHKVLILALIEYACDG